MDPVGGEDEDEGVTGPLGAWLEDVWGAPTAPVPAVGATDPLNPPVWRAKAPLEPLDDAKGGSDVPDDADTGGTCGCRPGTCPVLAANMDAIGAALGANDVKWLNQYGLACIILWTAAKLPASVSNSIPTAVCRFHLVRRFWYHVFTWVSDRLSLAASSIRSWTERYFCLSKLFSSVCNWWSVNAVRAFRCFFCIFSSHLDPLPEVPLLFDPLPLLPVTQPPLLEL